MRIFHCLIALLLSTAVVAEPALKFEMQNIHAQRVTEQSYTGKYLLMAVGYTTCPDVCPMTLLTMSSVIKGLGKHADKLQPLFISIDPNRDTVDKLREYVGFFDPSIDALVGSAKQTESIARNIGATYGYQLDGLPIDGEFPQRYEVYHSAYFYLYGPENQLVDVFGYGTKGSRMAQSILSYIEPKGGSHD